MKILIFILAVIAGFIWLGSVDVHSYSDYENWKIRNQVEIHSGLENMFRYQVYTQNKAKINKMNQIEGIKFTENEFMLLT